jgi:hypothetical protein
MGLDVYLYKYENIEDWNRREAIIEKFWEDGFESMFPGVEFKTATEDQTKAWRDKRAKLEAEHGIDPPVGRECIEQDEPRYPDHYFKIGYFRSSYNEGGINRLLQNAIGTDLATIFNAGDDYAFRPDWEAARTRCFDALERLRHYNKVSPYRCHSLSLNPFMGKEQCVASNEREAIEFTVQQMQKESSFGAWDTMGGTIYKSELLEVVAIVAGTHEHLLTRRQEPTHYVVYKADVLWYVNALEIVLATIDYVLKNSEPQKFYLHWSG